MKNKKPILVYDGGCSFCKYWTERWKKQTGDKVEYCPYQEVAGDFPEISRKEFKKAVQLVTEKGVVYSGAKAAFKTLKYGGNKKWFWVYSNIPLANYFFEFCYNIIAHNRPFFFKLTKLFFKDEN